MTLGLVRDGKWDVIRKWWEKYKGGGADDTLIMTEEEFAAWRTKDPAAVIYARKRRQLRRGRDLASSDEVHLTSLEAELPMLVEKAQPFIGVDTHISEQGYLEAVVDFCNAIFGFAPSQELLEEYEAIFQ